MTPSSKSVIIGLSISFLLGGLQAIYPQLSGVAMVIVQAIILVATFFAHQTIVATAVSKAKLSA